MDKPSGPTSHDVVARVRRALRTRAVGHTGTLDPFATGLLVVLVGRATRLARFVEQQAKTYLATARLGVRTSTDDLTGDVLAEGADQAGGAAELIGGKTARRQTGQPGVEELQEALCGFLGPQRQRPPAFSAKRVDGERSYAKARRGEAVELAEVEIVVHAMELVGYEYPDLQFRTTVSAGTYVRSLGRDLGDRLGTGAHLTALRREAIGELRVEQAVALDAIQPEGLLPPLAVLRHLARIDVTGDEAKALAFGQAVRRPGGLTTGAPITAVGPGDRLIAVGRVRDETFQPDVVLEAAG